MATTAEAHLAWVLERLPRLPVRTVPTRHSHGLTLARDVGAEHDLPLWDSSAMDGYAVRAADVASAGTASPVRLRVLGEVAAGSASDPAIPAGCAVRIMTGAPVPRDADAVVPVEATRGERPGEPWAAEEVAVLAASGTGSNVRRRGEDVRAGTVVARAGEVLGAARLAALAAAGVGAVEARPRPRVAVVVTGSELRAPGAPLARGQIPESNSVLLSALLAESGIEDVEVHVAADDAAALAARLAELGGRHDLVITTGGVGPGRHDVVRIALAGEPDVRAVRVAVKPGQPQCAGRLRSGAWIFALPGNPVSAAVSFELFVRPALLHAQGRAAVHRPRLPAAAAAPWRGAAGRLQVLPVAVTPGPDGLACRPVVDPRGVSHAVGGHGAADGYALVGPERGDVAAGERVDVILVAP